jgi:hypothetical protein
MLSLDAAKLVAQWYSRQRSPIGNGPRRLWICLDDGYPSGAAASATHSALYVLADYSALFLSIVILILLTVSYEAFWFD